MPELPPQSRITSRLNGEILSINIPSSSARVGCIGGSWAAAAVFGFLTVCCIAQGTFSHNMLWTAAGFLFFLITGWQLLALRGGLLRAPAGIKLEVGPESLAKISGTAETPHPQNWLRSTIAGIRVEAGDGSGPASLFLELRDEASAICLYSCNERDELEWIAEQIRRRLEKEKQRNTFLATDINQMHTDKTKTNS